MKMKKKSLRFVAGVLAVTMLILGMVYPAKGQVIRYAAGESEYVKQYQNIPNAD